MAVFGEFLQKMGNLAREIEFTVNRLLIADCYVKWSEKFEKDSFRNCKLMQMAVLADS